MTMPNFLIIGANKGGTTSLYNYLNQHPEIFMSKIKEPMFFTTVGRYYSKDEKIKKGLSEATTTLEDFQKLFQNVTNEKAIGEASTAYLANPSCAKVIKKYVIDMKLIAVLRHPIDRAYSNHKMYVRRGIEKRSFEESVSDELHGRVKGLGQGRKYMQLGFYSRQIKAFLDVFGRDLLKVYLFDFFRGNEDVVCRDIFSFLGVKEDLAVNTRVIHNSDNKDSARGNNDLVSSSIAGKTLKTLNAYYREDIECLQDILDIDLKHWLHV